MQSEQSPLSPASMFLSSQLGVGRDLGEGVKAGLNQPISLIHEEDEDEDKNANTGGAPKGGPTGAAGHSAEMVVEDSLEKAEETNQDA